MLPVPVFISVLAVGGLATNKKAFQDRPPKKAERRCIGRVMLS